MQISIVYECFCREWKEGLLSSIVSTAADTSTWIILNGDVEPSWAEALNSALDDNRLLTLPSGVALRLSPGVRYESLDFHSPTNRTN